MFCFVCLLVFFGVFFWIGGGGSVWIFSCFSCLIASMCISKLIKLKKDVTVKL